MTNWNELKRLAEEATHGDWYVGGTEDCYCIATELATDEENMASKVDGFCGKVEVIDPMRIKTNNDEGKNE